MRYGFVRDLFARGIPTDTVKKLLHHTPTSTDAVSFSSSDYLSSLFINL